MGYYNVDYIYISLVLLSIVFVLIGQVQCSKHLFVIIGQVSDQVIKQNFHAVFGKYSMPKSVVA